MKDSNDRAESADPTQSAIGHGASFLPGFSALRSAVKRRVRPAIGKSWKDVTAGFSVAINDVPDGMACGMLSGVSPVAGLYAAIFGPFVAGLLNSSALMIVTTTSAAAFVSGQVLASYPEDLKASALLVMVLIAGAIMAIGGLLRLGNLVQYVSYSVMTGFLYGIAVLTILSQLPAILGITAGSGNTVLKTIGLLGELDRMNWRTLTVALATLFIILLLSKTALSKLAAIIAVVVPSLLVFFLGWEEISVVNDISEIRGGLPEFYLPDLSLIGPSLIAGSLSLCAVVLVQAAGVSQAIPNITDKGINHSRNFIGQGAANIVSSVFGGVAVGGSLGSTSLNLVSGARTRLAAILTGVSVFVLVLAFPGLVSNVAMPVLAMIMIFASAGAIKIRELRQIWKLRNSTRILISVTFLITLLVPVQYAILCGVSISVALYFYTSSREVTMRMLEPRSGKFAETKVPARLKSDSITILQISGDIHFAGARTVERLLPLPSDHAKNTFVILRLRHRETMGATIIDVIDSYSEKLLQTGGALYVTGLSKKVAANFRDMQHIHVLESVRVYPETEIIGEGTWQAFEDARKELLSRG